MTQKFVWTVDKEGWYGPTEGLLEAIQLYNDAGLARTGSAHLYKPAKEVPEGTLPRFAATGESKLCACIDPKAKSRMSGVGIAFSQLEMARITNYRIFAMLTGLPDITRANIHQGKVTVYRNARYTPVKSAGRTKRRERCLSAPGLWCEVWRWNEIDVQFAGSQGTVRLTGVDAWIFQHEADHTDGILCHDRAFEQQLGVYYVSPELADDFLSLDRLRDWPYPVASGFWKALKLGKFDFTKQPRS